ncbi:MAG: UvrD-helicase domain-containing protein, partial [Lachnospiraceae bacterium]|nr:UvrD-helicase domain-containing protein [Lachnospiraceae bacterium]
MIQGLNNKQKEAVLNTEGPLLILAGAGSGKTRVITNRIAYLIQDKHVDPKHILAITFTNKAAEEMRERVQQQVGMDAGGAWISTFHSCCARILRMYSHLIGYDNNFSIYDADDQKTIVKNICKKLEIDTKRFKEKWFIGQISSAKDELI